MKQIRDAVVIGAGIIGSATAWALTQAGVKRVTLIEKGPLASGMTRRNAGLVHPFHAHPLSCEMANASYQLYNQFLSALGGKPLFAQTGAAFVTVDGQALGELPTAITSYAPALPPDVFRGMFPAVSQKIDSVLYTPDAGYADAVLTAHAMVNAGKERGLEIQTGTQVKQILVEQGHVKGVRTTTGELEAPNVIVTAGGWTEKLLMPLGFVQRLRFRRGIVAFYEQPPSLREDLPMLLDADGECFFRPHPYHMSAAGRVSTRIQPQGADQIDEFVVPGETAAVEQFMSTCIPAFANIPAKRAHAVVYATGADGLPILGHVSFLQGLYAGAGFGTSTFSVAPAVGETLAQLVVDGSAARDITAFAPARKTENQL